MLDNNQNIEKTNENSNSLTSIENQTTTAKGKI